MVELKSVCVLFGASLLVIAAAAQPVIRPVQCLPAADRQQIEARTRAITEDVERKKQSAGTAAPTEDLQLLRQLADVALQECARQRSESQSTLEACPTQLSDVRWVADQINKAGTMVGRVAVEPEQELRLRLRAMRAEFPSCPSRG